MPVPLFDTATPLAPLEAEIRAKIDEVVASKRFIFGPEVTAFEREFGAYIGAKHCLGVANGTDALLLALRALAVGPGDEVIVPSFTFFASAEPIALLGATPVWCDIDPATFLSTPEMVEAVLTPRTKAIIAVHLFGNVAPVEELLRFGLPVIEDAAQSAGTRFGDRRPGALGTIATFSFFPSKNLGAFGDGGAITTDDDDLAELIEHYRFHGSKDKRTFVYVGHNSRLDALQAAILRVQLPHLDAWSDGRRVAARAYEEAGLGELVTLPVPVGDPAWHLFVVRSERADELIATLREAEIGSAAYYRVPAHRQPAMREFASGDLPGTEEAAQTNLALPISPVLTREQARAVVAAAAGTLAPAASPTCGTSVAYSGHGTREGKHHG